MKGCGQQLASRITQPVYITHLRFLGCEDMTPRTSENKFKKNCLENQHGEIHNERFSELLNRSVHVVLPLYIQIVLYFITIFTVLVFAESF